MPVRYVVLHDNGEGYVSYSTKLKDAFSYARQTASRYHGEIFEGHETSEGPVLLPVKSYRRD